MTSTPDGTRNLTTEATVTTNPQAPSEAPSQNNPIAGLRDRIVAQQTDRRRFVGYLVAAATVTGAAQFGLAGPAAAVIPAVPEPSDLYDLNDLLTDAARPTSNLISVSVHPDGTASFELPRAEVGQGVTTSFAMLIAEELDMAVSSVNVTLAPARPELVWNQITGGSNSMHSMYVPVRIAAAVVRGALLHAASLALATPNDQLSVFNGVVTAPNGQSISYGALATQAAALVNSAVGVNLKPDSAFRIIGKSQNRKDALAAVTGKKQFAMDLEIPGALPAMVCRPPQLNGTAGAILNLAAVQAMPGVTHVVTIPTGVAVRAHTFGQCIDAIRALQVNWNPGTAPTASDASVLGELRAAQRPFLSPAAPLLATTIDTDFTFYFRSGSPLETNCAVADVRSTSATIWASSKTPIAASEQIALDLGMLPGTVKFNVVDGGGSFGRKLFWDGAREAALISQKCGAPVRLMWHRADEPRQGRNHPMATSRIRTTFLGDNVLTFEQQHTSIATDFRHGFGELLSSMEASLPGGIANMGDSEAIWTLSQQVPYNFGVTTQQLVETDDRFNTSSVRNIYSPDARCAVELTVDQMAARMGLDPLAFRLKYARDPRLVRVLNQVATAGNWGRPMAPGTAQGIAVHQEYKGFSACLVEIDCTPATVNRVITNGVGGPRVTRVTFAIDCGLVVNPKGVEAQMQGGINDGIALALTASSHLQDGHFLEASWDNYFYTRQWNTPYDVKVFVMTPVTDIPGGVGEAGVASSFAAVACAYARATGTMPTSFPINHNGPLGFEVKSFVPPVPASPTDGLNYTY